MTPSYKPQRDLLTMLCISLIVMGVSTPAWARWEESKQKELDAVCEQAREKVLAPLRQQFVEECVAEKQQPDRASCERFYADYGARSGGRAPLFYDLPECEEAFNYNMGR